MTRALVFALGLFLALSGTASAAITLANTAANNACTGTTCAATVTSTSGDLVFGICTMGNPTSGAEGTPSFAGPASAVLTTAEFNSPWFYITATAQLRASGSTTTMTCNTAGSATDAYVHLFDFTATSGSVVIDCLSWAIGLLDSAPQSTVAQTPSTTSDLAFAYEISTPTTGMTFTIAGGGAPTCTLNSITGVNAGYCTAQLTAAGFTSVSTPATSAGDAYGLGFVMFTTVGGGATNPALFVPSGQVGFKDR